MEYSYEWKDKDGYLHRVQFGTYISSAIRDAAEEDAKRYGISVEDAVNIILNGLTEVDMAKEELGRINICELQ